MYGTRWAFAVVGMNWEGMRRWAVVVGENIGSVGRERMEDVASS